MSTNLITSNERLKSFVVNWHFPHYTSIEHIYILLKMDKKKMLHTVIFIFTFCSSLIIQSPFKIKIKTRLPLEQSSSRQGGWLHEPEKFQHTILYDICYFYLGQSKSSVVTILFPYRKLKEIFFFSYSDREKNALFFYDIWSYFN